MKTSFLSDPSNAVKLEEFRDRLATDKEFAKRIWRQVMGPPSRELEGDEYIRILNLIQVTSPVRISNNQHTITEEYILNGTEYHMTTGIYDAPTITEMIKETS